MSSVSPQVPHFNGAIVICGQLLQCWTVQILHISVTAESPIGQYNIIISWFWSLHKSVLNKCVHQSLPSWHFFSPSWVRDIVMVGLLQMYVGVSDLVWGRGKSHSYWLLWLLSPSLPWGDLAMMVSRGDFMGLSPNDSGVKDKTRSYQRGRP